ncbi:uncharacterized protein LOC135829020 [Sycon ciliatum]|uniref:uncharacterized protein LOC135829020 n=1 Tax=Sycon ciliatum TaxID=27933 RepID=UPI0020AB2C04|eukprot:scpid94054/ scgid13747/ 
MAGGHGRLAFGALWCCLHLQITVMAASDIPESLDLQLTEEMQEVNAKHCTGAHKTHLKVYHSDSTDVEASGSPVSKCTPEQEQFHPPTFMNDNHTVVREDCPFQWQCTFQETRSPQAVWQAVPLAERCENGHGQCKATQIFSVIMHLRGCADVSGEPQWIYNLMPLAIDYACDQSVNTHFAL